MGVDQHNQQHNQRIFQRPRRMEPGEDLADFHCGVPLIDEWAHTRATSAAKHGTAVVYVSRTTAGDTAGFYTLSSYAVERSRVLGGWLRRNTPDRIPAILLGMLGVALPYRGEGLGWRLLQDAIARARAASEQIGARALIVDPYDDSAESFYAHFGFQEIPGTDSMYLRLVWRPDPET
ncbi:hypothetical protein BW13_07720 [Bifidobacterium sp. UTCIF-37]|nr:MULTISPECIES: GNAT family N-acetyltransferase [Bifidobacterium]TPF86091.1 hypothetical protein BW13_07720 [Bifidobacterium sp. UTCIF-37]TPF88184.1 hypothetical protein BW11_08065 [Bifidobacterium sp. UTCIF-38]